MCNLTIRYYHIIAILQVSLIYRAQVFVNSFLNLNGSVRLVSVGYPGIMAVLVDYGCIGKIVNPLELHARWCQFAGLVCGPITIGTFAHFPHPAHGTQFVQLRAADSWHLHWQPALNRLGFCTLLTTTGHGLPTHGLSGCPSRHCQQDKRDWSASGASNVASALTSAQFGQSSPSK